MKCHFTLHNSFTVTSTFSFHHLVKISRLKWQKCCQTLPGWVTRLSKQAETSSNTGLLVFPQKQISFFARAEVHCENFEPLTYSSRHLIHILYLPAVLVYFFPSRLSSSVHEGNKFVTASHCPSPTCCIPALRNCGEQNAFINVFWPRCCSYSTVLGCSLLSRYASRMQHCTCWQQSIFQISLSPLLSPLENVRALKNVSTE